MHLRLDFDPNGADLHPYLKTKLHFNGKHFSNFLKSEQSKLLGVELHHLLTIELHFELPRALFALVERRQRHVAKLYVLIQHAHFNDVKINSKAEPRVFHCHVEAEVEEELAVVGEVELGQVGVYHLELDLVGHGDEP